MNIDAKFFGAIMFLLVQTIGAIWWASSLTSEVERLAGIQGRAIPALEAEAKQCGIEIHNLKKLTGDQEKIAESVKNLDVMLYRLQSIEQMLDKILATKVRLCLSIRVQRGGAMVDGPCQRVSAFRIYWVHLLSR